MLYALLLKLDKEFSFFRILGDVHLLLPLPARLDVEFISFGETPSSTSSASVLISIFCNTSRYYNENETFSVCVVFALARSAAGTAVASLRSLKCRAISAWSCLVRLPRNPHRSPAPCPNLQNHQSEIIYVSRWER